MASIYQRKNKDGSKVWRAVIRIKGHPSVSNHFERKREVEDWAYDTEQQIRLGSTSLTAQSKAKPSLTLSTATWRSPLAIATSPQRTHGAT